MATKTLSQESSSAETSVSAPPSDVCPEALAELLIEISQSVDSGELAASLRDAAAELLDGPPGVALLRRIRKLTFRVEQDT